MRLMLYFNYPRISYKLFKEYYWFDLYRYAQEAISPNISESRGHGVSISMFVDADLAGDKSTRFSQTRVLVFINKSTIHCYIKRQGNFEASTFGADFCAMKAGVKMVQALCYKLQMFGVPIHGSANLFVITRPDTRTP